MQLFRNRKWRPFPVAIMLVATVAVVWHGAMSLLAHPLTSGSHLVAMMPIGLMPITITMAE
jgi:hydrogenase/urease accessory protein HupE